MTKKTRITIKEALAKYSNVEIELLLTNVLGKTKEFLYLSGEKRLSAGQLISLSALVKRRQKGEPVAYILGYKDFMGLRFKVHKNVLIPRPETEGLVEHLLGVILRPSSHQIAGRRISAKEEILRPDQSVGAQDDAGVIKVLDVGTGSGCIAISLAKNLSVSNIKYQISASDVSPAALKVAKENARRHKLKVKFVQSDLLKNVKGNFDVIIANLPYVPDADFKKLKNNLKYEPKQSIFAKENGLLEIRRLLEQIADIKYQPLFVYLEFDPRQKTELHRLIKKYLPNRKVNFYKDLSGRWRFAEVIPKPNV